MAIIRFQNMENPFERLFHLQNELDRYLDREMFGYPSTFGRGLFPAFNLFEKESDYIVTMELPGFNEKDINVQVMDRQLVISGKRTLQSEEKGMIYHRRERQSGEFNRTFTLPDKVDSEKVKASLKNGVLTLTIGKAKDTMPKSISVTTE